MSKKQYRILLLGDECIDRYQYGYVDRISPEAPVPIFRFSHETECRGMAGNVQKNLVNLGCTVDYIFDPNRTELAVKTRLIDLRSRQQLLRIDNDYGDSRPYQISADQPIKNFDAVVISDYNKGLVSYDNVINLRQAYQGPIFVDTKKTDLARLQGCIIKINEVEFSKLESICRDLVVTLGSAGAKYQDQLIPTRPQDVVDTCGAGDTFLAALCVGYLDHAGNISKAIEFANRAAAVTVQHLGVYAPTMEEICGSKV
jgi:D-beta-D-heptose 7-phosphate kinase/D-beta-D-heptose 1-phosphate adenosyltransferase